MIPLSVPDLRGNEWRYVQQCLDSGWISSAGPFVSQFEQAIAKYVGCSHGIATVNGTTALHTALLIAGVKPTDTVVLPNLTFVASANSVKHACAEPAFIDVNENSWQIDFDLLYEFLAHDCIRDHDGQLRTQAGSKVSAIMTVHVLGGIADMGILLNIASEFGLPVIEDASEALGSKFDGKHAGSIGLIGVLSFNGNKIVTTGGGGMILTNSDEMAARARHLTTTAKVDADNYFHDEVAYNYRMVNILAAIGLAQMERFPEMLARRREIAALYVAGLANLPQVRQQHHSPKSSTNCWLHTVRALRGSELRTLLKESKIQSRALWMPMNRLPMYRQAIYKTRQDIAGQLHAECISLPSSTTLSNVEIQRVIDCIHTFYGVRS